MGLHNHIVNRLPRRLKDQLRHQFIPDETDLVYQTMKGRAASRIMLDVGACMGHAFSSFANDGWTVYAFEPDPVNRDTLTRTWGNVPTVRVDPRAVSNRTASDIPFFRSEVSAGISGLSSFHESHKASGTVETTTLDLFCHEEKITKVDFLKVDTEGFDLFVLQGMPWSEASPRMVMCEFEDSKTTPLGYTFDDLANYLHDLQYHVLVSEWHPIVNYGGPHRWHRFVPYPTTLANPNAWGNLIAARDQDDFERLLSVSKGRAASWRFGTRMQQLLTSRA